MLKFLSPEHLARFSARRPWLVLALWLFLIVGSVAGMAITKVAESDAESPNSESERASAHLEETRGEAPPTENIIVVSETANVDSAAFRSFVTDLTAQLRGLDGTVLSVSNYYETNDSTLVSPDNHKTIIAATLAGTKNKRGLMRISPLLLPAAGAYEAPELRALLSESPVVSLGTA